MISLIDSIINLLLVSMITCRNIESAGNGSFCISKLPKRAIPSNCTSLEMCERVLNVSPPPAFYFYSSTILQCGDQGECVTNLTPKNEYCKDACESSDCSSLCLQLYETKTAKYCIETRDHPNAMPSGGDAASSIVNNYYCTCMLPPTNKYHHKVVSRRLEY